MVLRGFDMVLGDFGIVLEGSKWFYKDCEVGQEDYSKVLSDSRMF